MLCAFLGVKEGRDVQVHICAGTKQAPHAPHHFAQLPHSDWKKAENDACPHCQSLRFLKIGGGLRPRKMAYYIGIGAAIRSLFAEKEFCKGREQFVKDRDNSATSFWSSAEAERLEQLTGVFFKADSSAWELGFDVGKIF